MLGTAVGPLLRLLETYLLLEILKIPIDPSAVANKTALIPSRVAALAHSGGLDNAPSRGLASLLRPMSSNLPGYVKRAEQATLAKGLIKRANINVPVESQWRYAASLNSSLPTSKAWATLTLLIALQYLVRWSIVTLLALIRPTASSVTAVPLLSSRSTQGSTPGLQTASPSRPHSPWQESSPRISETLLPSHTRHAQSSSSQATKRSAPCQIPLRPLRSLWLSCMRALPPPVRKALASFCSRPALEIMGTLARDGALLTRGLSLLAIGTTDAWIAPLLAIMLPNLLDAPLSSPTRRQAVGHSVLYMLSLGFLAGFGTEQATTSLLWAIVVRVGGLSLHTSSQLPEHPFSTPPSIDLSPRGRLKEAILNPHAASAAISFAIAMCCKFAASVDPSAEKAYASPATKWHVVLAYIIVCQLHNLDSFWEPFCLRLGSLSSWQEWTKRRFESLRVSLTVSGVALVLAYKALAPVSPSMGLPEVLGIIGLLLASAFEHGSLRQALAHTWPVSPPETPHERPPMISVNLDPPVRPSLRPRQSNHTKLDDGENEKAGVDEDRLSQASGSSTDEDTRAQGLANLDVTTLGFIVLFSSIWLAFLLCDPYQGIARTARLPPTLDSPPPWKSIFSEFCSVSNAVESEISRYNAGNWTPSQQDDAAMALYDQELVASVHDKDLKVQKVAYNETTFIEYLDYHFPKSTQHLWITLADDQFSRTATRHLQRFVQLQNVKAATEARERMQDPPSTPPRTATTADSATDAISLSASTAPNVLVERHLVVLCVDEGCLRTCRQQGWYCYGGYEATRSREWMRATWPKVAGLHDILQSGRSVFFVDSDVFFRGEPLYRMAPLDSSDVQYQEEMVGDKINTGWSYSRPTEAVIKLYERLMYMNHEKVSRDQVNTNEILATEEIRLEAGGWRNLHDFVSPTGIKVHVMNPEYFRVYHSEFDDQWQTVSDQHAVALHMTCCDNAFLKQYIAAHYGYLQNLDGYYSRPPLMITADVIAGDYRQLNAAATILMAVAAATGRAFLPPSHAVLHQAGQTFTRPIWSVFRLDYLQRENRIDLLEPNYVIHAAHHLAKEGDLDTIAELSDVLEINIRQLWSLEDLIELIQSADISRHKIIKLTNWGWTFAHMQWPLPQRIADQHLKICAFIEEPQYCAHQCRMP
ncbi:uncharacterized protein L969DRAFT_104055 [Mixia osmundae IAM 14324]|uniref:Nucleotide-diphospho-sugar transferase domain-containing protein n=1 Tax=Mixia osmundae (strain CBS 9802 / IAM 14324 / JCM 22182 / KY 12970) TaxID=764103 RepID=G7E6R2_MIXOS|nr:uncharacterized protein L969DRAFT_104055 [Mixia osmundae IAM 14324]KEI39096.1 hypothetical protein L969DRAFT_104055 [Mixia osmundae IAM 14324]GAA98522.1 hypothetical protein E5Q_05208 [Mixia osmundae IAM 14324]